MLREMDNMFNMISSRKHKESIKRPEDEDGFLNTSRYQCSERMAVDPK